jgi:hypothetical protein
MYIDAHSHFGTFDYPNDEKQAKLTILLSGVMALVTVVLIVLAIFSPSA